MLNYSGSWIKIYFPNVKFWKQSLKLVLSYLPLILCWMLDRLFRGIALLYLMYFLIEFVSGLEKTISPFPLLSRLEFLWANRSLSSVALYPFMQLKVNSANRTLYILSRLSHRVCIKTSAVLVSYYSPYTIRPALASSFSRWRKFVLLHAPKQLGRTWPMAL